MQSAYAENLQEKGFLKGVKGREKKKNITLLLLSLVKPPKVQKDKSDEGSALNILSCHEYKMHFNTMLN